MYENFYGFREKPFSILPDPEVIFWGRAHRMAYAMLEFGVLNNAGFTVITGEIGSGKTTLLQHLLTKIDPRVIRVGSIFVTPRTRDELLQWIMASLDQPFDLPPAALLKSFAEVLRHEQASGRRTILVVDEAQNLQEEALETLRMLSNINLGKRQMLQLILVGQPELKEILSRPQMQQFAQRVSSDFHLKPLMQPEVEQYINFRVQAAGSPYQPFSAEACARIAEASGGIPRIINILCDTALVYGYSVRSQEVTPTLVNEVIEDKRNFGIFPANGSAVKC